MLNLHKKRNMAAPEPQTQSRRALGFMSHTLLITMIFIIPDVVGLITMPHRHTGINLSFFVKTAVYVAVFYLNFFVLIDRYLGNEHTRRRFVRFLLVNLLIIAVGMVICFAMGWFNYRPRPDSPNAEFWRKAIKVANFTIRDLVMMVLSVALAVAMRLSEKWKEIEQQRQEILAAQRATELDSLKSQLNPHFLFNTLNTIYALIAIDRDNAQHAVHRLSSLLRYVLYDDQGMVPLERECAFIENYVGLMRLRIANRPIKTEIDMGQHAGTQIPALLFIPLVENALKYGTDADDKVPVEISIVANDHTLVCSTSNSFITRRKDDGERAERKSGIGLANLRRRLTLIYGPAARLSSNITGNIYTARLTVPI